MAPLYRCLTALAALFITTSSLAQNKEPIILGYFPTWSESWASANQNSKLREVPAFVNHLFLAFAKPNLHYEKGSFDISQTGIEVPYDGCLLKESISALKDKGIKVILSVGGETFWGTQEAYNIDYQQIKDLVDDLGFAGIDWDYEPDGSFANIGAAENVQHFIDFFNESRAIMPRSEGYILACAPSGVGALGGSINDDTESPFAFSKRNELTGEDDTQLYQGTVSTNGINLFGFSATGHMIPVMEAVGDKIDLIAYQGYNVGGSNNRSIMYDAYAYYAEKYDFDIAAGVHYPNEPWGPYYEFTHENVASLADHIASHPDRQDNADGLMIWQILLEGNGSSAYSYMNVGQAVLNGSTTSAAVSAATDFEPQPYTGGAEGCGDDVGGNEKYCDAGVYNPENTYPTPDTEVYFDCKVWKNKWYANPQESPGVNEVWEEVRECTEHEDCGPSSTKKVTHSIRLFPNPAEDFIRLKGIQKPSSFTIYNSLGMQLDEGTIYPNSSISIDELPKGFYFIHTNGKVFKFQVK